MLQALHLEKIKMPLPTVASKARQLLIPKNLKLTEIFTIESSESQKNFSLKNSCQKIKKIYAKPGKSFSPQFTETLKKAILYPILPLMGQISTTLLPWLASLTNFLLKSQEKLSKI